MLEVRNLTKVYRSKTGEQVRALDNVSITFPESGMVFILGKSGSGKSTLLNVIGGLDSYDSGEFIIKGKSSKDFGGSDFDAYRNTFIGFIFQEYNVLDDFTVGANIGLALELQGKKATSQKITDILSQVDLVNYAKRKPNELSGGQKQRVAIARALVKEPQIIMADEPTGALDSNTGKAIFDTLKNLSREKLVLVVSHDRDFAERYADRIIELSDGNIISDVTKHERKSQRVSEGVERINANIFRIKKGYRLTAEDVQLINTYLGSNKTDVLLSGDGRVNEELRSAAGISEHGTTAVFEGTDSEKDYTLREYEKSDSKFIRSRLPMKNAVRIGSSGLKHKKFRLVMTILLSLIAFALFGFADSAAGYDKITATVDSILDSNVKNASMTVGVRHTMTYDDGDSHTYFNMATLNDDDVAYLREKTGLDFVPVYTGSRYGNGGFSVSSMMQAYETNTVYTGRLSGLVNMSEESLQATGFTWTGNLPKDKGEIMITELMYRQLNEYGFVNTRYDESVPAGSLQMTEGSANSIIGKHLTLSSSYGGGMSSGGSDPYAFVIVGVVDTGFDYDRYQDFLPKDENALKGEENNALTEMVLMNELESELGYGFHALGFVTRESVDALSALNYELKETLSTSMNAWNSSMYVAIRIPQSGDSSGEKDPMGESEHTIRSVAPSSALASLNVTYLDGRVRTALAENEVVVPANIFNSLRPQSISISLDPEAVKAKVNELYGTATWEGTGDDTTNYRDRWLQAAGDWDRAQKDMVEFMLPYYGLQMPDGLSNELKAQIYSRIEYDVLTPLRNMSDANLEGMSVSYYTYRDILCSMQAIVDVDQSRLWENDAYVQMMIDREYITNQEWTEHATDVEYKRDRAQSFYIYYYLVDSQMGYTTNAFGPYSGQELDQKAQAAFFAVSGLDLDSLASSVVFECFEDDYKSGSEKSLGKKPYKIVGYYETDGMFGDMLVSDTLMQEYRAWKETADEDVPYKEEIAEHADGPWSFVIAPMGSDPALVRQLVEMTYDETGDLQFCLQNAVMNTLGTFNDFIESAAKIFLYIGIGFAVFSALLLMNFISTSISYKKREIGVLRAVGARSSDVFKIFFSEALIIAAINFVLSAGAVITAIYFTNDWMRKSGINVTLLSFGPRQIILMLAVSVLVALLASFLPVYNIARRKPIDAIKDR